MAEASTPQMVKEAKSSCCICLAEVTDYARLPCLHGFCFECLWTRHQESKDKTHIVCPVCEKSTATPVHEGIMGFQELFFGLNLQETTDNKATESKPDRPCCVCGEKADIYCTDCQKSLCQPCHTNHNKFTKDHQVVTIEAFQSGQVSTEGCICPLHGEQVRYYCETEDRQVCMDCIGLKTCQPWDRRVILKDSASKQREMLQELRKQCADKKKRLQDTIKDTETLKDALCESVTQAKLKADQCMENYKEQVDKVFKKQIEEIDRLEKERVKAIEENTHVLKSEIGKIDDADKQASYLADSNSDFLITNKYPSLSRELMSQLSMIYLVRPDTSLGCMQFESFPMPVPTVESIFQRKLKWKPAGQISTNGMKQQRGIAINHDGNVAVTSFVRGVKVFSRNGLVKCTFMDSGAQITDIAVTHDNRYVVTGEVSYTGMRFYTSEGRRLPSVRVYSDSNNDKALVQSVTTDTNDRIVAGLVNRTISTHYADGSLISKFRTKHKPRHLAATSDGEIVCTYYHTNLVQIRDYSGSRAREVDPPKDVKIWSPAFLCCSQGYIFVTNELPGFPTGVYRFTSAGQYVDCVTTEVNNPQGIALSDDGMQLFVAEENDSVKIFQRV